MSTPFSTNYTPPAPVFNIRLAAPGKVANTDQLTAIIDTGSDSTLVPTHYLEQVEAIGVGDAILHGVLGETREVHLFEIDILIESQRLPGMIVVGDDYGQELILGRDVLNKLILLLDGQQANTSILERRPQVSNL